MSLFTCTTFMLFHMFIGSRQPLSRLLTMLDNFTLYFFTRPQLESKFNSSKRHPTDRGTIFPYRADERNPFTSDIV